MLLSLQRLVGTSIKVDFEAWQTRRIPQNLRSQVFEKKASN